MKLEAGLRVEIDGARESKGRGAREKTGRRRRTEKRAVVSWPSTRRRGLCLVDLGGGGGAFRARSGDEGIVFGGAWPIWRVCWPWDGYEGMGLDIKGTSEM